MAQASLSINGRCGEPFHLMQKKGPGQCEPTGAMGFCLTTSRNAVEQACTMQRQRWGARTSHGQREGSDQGGGASHLNNGSDGGDVPVTRKGPGR